MSLTTLAINCTLKPSPNDSSCGLLLSRTMELFNQAGAPGEIIRAVDCTIKPGVTADEGEDDDWPALRDKVLEADILLLGTPIWLGHPSSECQRVLERLDAMLSDKDEGGRMLTFGRVAAVAVVGNEDGAHHVAAELFQALNDVGYTIPASATAYWVGEAMQAVDFKDLPKTPDKTQGAMEVLVNNCVHLAKLLKQGQYPEVK